MRRIYTLTGIALHVHSFALSPDLTGLESLEVLKGSHETGSMRVSFHICIQEKHYTLANAIFRNHLV